MGCLVSSEDKNTSDMIKSGSKLNTPEIEIKDKDSDDGSRFDKKENDSEIHTGLSGFKIAVVGPSKTGKSSICLRFCENAFLDKYEPTLGAKYLSKKIEINSTEYEYKIWDISGDPKYRNRAHMYYKETGAAEGILFVYDMTQKNSLVELKSWIEEISQELGDNIQKILVGNKCDLESQREISVGEAQEFAEENNLGWAEVSAKQSSGVNEIFSQLTELMLKAKEAQD